MGPLCFNADLVAQVKAGKYLSLLHTLHQALPDEDGGAFSSLKAQVGATLEQKNLSQTERLDHLRHFYLESVIPQLRASQQNREAGAADVCYHLITQNDLSKATDQLFSLFQPADETRRPLLERLQNWKKAIDQAPDDQKIPPAHRMAASVRDYFDWNFSPVELGNPYQRFGGWTFFQGHLKVIAMGSPTIQGFYWPMKANLAQIDPLFLGFLDGLRKREERYLYVSFQDASSSEAERNDPLMHLSRKDQYKASFIAMTCSKNSPFYLGIGHEGSKEAFLGQVHAQFFGLSVKESGCLPPMEGDLKEKSAKILFMLGELLLSEQPQEMERKALIDFYYALLISCAAFDHKANFVSFTCKDAIDRGMESLALFCLLWFSVKGMDLEDPKVERAFAEILFSRAYWVRKRSMLDLRFERFIQNGALWLLKWKHPEKRAAFQSCVKELIPLDVDAVVSLI